jgi:hypothetical protein
MGRELCNKDHTEIGLSFNFFIGGMKRKTTTNTTTIKSKDKGKAIPLQAWTGPEGSRRLRLPDFKTIVTLRW